MHPKQLNFLSDKTLCSLFSQGTIVPEKVSIDLLTFEHFVEARRMKKKKRYRPVLIIFISALIFINIWTVYTGILSEGALGLVDVFIIIGSLLYYNFFLNKEDKTKILKKYEQAFLSSLHKEKTLENSSQENVFNALIRRVIFLIDFTPEGHEKRILGIIQTINQTHEESRKVFKVISNFETLKTKLSQVFEEGNPDIDTFIGRQSFRKQTTQEIKMQEQEEVFV